MMSIIWYLGDTSNLVEKIYFGNINHAIETVPFQPDQSALSEKNKRCFCLGEEKQCFGSTFVFYGSGSILKSEYGSWVLITPAGYFLNK